MTQIKLLPSHNGTQVGLATLHKSQSLILIFLKPLDNILMEQFQLFELFFFLATCEGCRVRNHCAREPKRTIGDNLSLKLLNGKFHIVLNHWEKWINKFGKCDHTRRVLLIAEFNADKIGDRSAQTRQCH